MENRVRSNAHPSVSPHELIPVTACTVARSAGIAARLKKRVPLTLPCDLKDRPHSHDE
jgi:hypothetical protein